MSKTVGIVACSNAQKAQNRSQNQSLIRFLEESSCHVKESKCIYEKDGWFAGTGKERAAELMKMFADPAVTDIFDISGGDMANEILDDLDYPVIAGSKAVFWGYSDLTTVINAIYTMTGKPSVLYSPRNLAAPQFQEVQRWRYLDGHALFEPAFRLVQGSSLHGTVVGGNIRCFMKLAGTRYFPDLQDKVLFLEARSGQVPQMVSLLSQLRSCGAFEKVSGILLGTFTEMEAKNCRPDIPALLRSFAGPDLPIAVTNEVGHSPNSKALWIGKEIRLSSRNS